MLAALALLSFAPIQAVMLKGPAFRCTDIRAIVRIQAVKRLKSGTVEDKVKDLFIKECEVLRSLRHG